VLRLTNGKGVDQVIENGGSTTLLRSVKSTRLGGLVSLIGFLGGPEKLSEETLLSIIYGAVVGESAYERGVV
jgi:NADPH:quinone reductase-like Zn-dependent oxidoreductase